MSFTDCVDRWLGLDTAAQDGVAWGIDCSWPWPAWITLLVLAVAVAFIVGLYLRESSRASRRFRLVLASIRLILFGMLLLMLAQVTLSVRRTALPAVAVIVDNSRSMSIVDRYGDDERRDIQSRLEAAGVEGGLSRWNLAVALLTEREQQLLRGMAERHKLGLYCLGDTRPLASGDASHATNAIRSAAPVGEHTALGAGIRAVLDDLRGAAPAAIVVMSDGINTDGPPLSEAAEDARTRGVPLFFVGLGSDRGIQDLKLSGLLADDAVLLGDVITFDCKLLTTGFHGEKVTITIRETDRPDVLAKTDVTIDSDEAVIPIRIPLRPAKTGQVRYTLQAEPLQGELLVDNNRLTHTVDVRSGKLRVLLAQATPNFEFRYLRNMLERDETIELHTYLQEADPNYASQDATALRALPVRREELFAYDAIILGDLDPALIGPRALQTLADFVTEPAKGGSLVLIAGPSFMPRAYRDTPLAPLMPFGPENARLPVNDDLANGFVVRPSDIGLASPPMQLGDSPEETRRIWSQLPPLYWLFEAPELKAGARVLAEHPTRRGPDGRPLPVVCLTYVGAGKVLFHATDETWRWRFRTGDLYFARYWGQMLRYLCRNDLKGAGGPVSLATERREYGQGEPVLLRVRFADQRLAPAEDDGVTVAVERSSGQTSRLQLHRVSAERGVFEGRLSDLAPGQYRARLVAPVLKRPTPSADFQVAPAGGELANTRMDSAAMRTAAEQTGGRFYTFAAADHLLDALPAGRPTLVETLPPKPLWNTWPVVAVFLTLLIAEWILRKRRGML